ncbi:hypothetical protein TL16_g10395 [Triparma laevis f. inornata]|uniref:1,4-dihydroxy-2-naphthoyl-CoA synthase n=1 Tax=Triparma laevis f. inornata TaxID=1714386 RepID=A0A9W7B833_9STRA|nr:hypothetical protein TL16_g10395 [Triparma laevis f. inornata]
MPYPVPSHVKLTDVEMEVFRPSEAEFGICRISIDRQRRKNAFRPETVEDLIVAFRMAEDDPQIGCIILQGKGKDFCAGGDQSVRGEGGYSHSNSEVPPRLKVLDLHVQMKRCPKPIMAVVKGYAVGGGHILHMVCDITLCDNTAVFGQTGPRMGSFDAGYGCSRMARLTGPRMGSFDAGYGCSRMARLVGQKKARELWFLAKFYHAKEAADMGLVNKVVERGASGWGVDYEAIKWARRMMGNSPSALACLKAALNADEDGAAGMMQLAGNATRLYYLTDEGKEGREAFLAKRPPYWRKIPSSKL